MSRCCHIFGAALVCLLAGSTASAERSLHHNRSGGTIRRANLDSRVLGERRELMVYLPPGYNPRGHKRYDLLVMGDGQNLFRRGGWGLNQTLEREAASGRAREVIVVGVVAGRRRNTESTPTFDPDKGFGGGADKFLRFHTDELLPWARRNLRVKAGPSHTAIGGSSMLGLFSTYAHYKRPDVFGAAISMSPSYWWHGKKLLREIAGQRQMPRLRLYMDSGGPEAETAFNTTRELQGILESKGLAFGRGYWHRSVNNHGHNEAAWRERFPLALRTIFPAR